MKPVDVKVVLNLLNQIGESKFDVTSKSNKGKDSRKYPLVQSTKFTCIANTKTLTKNDVAVLSKIYQDYPQFDFTIHMLSDIPEEPIVIIITDQKTFRF